jgi:hypothetical protein
MIVLGADLRPPPRHTAIDEPKALQRSLDPKSSCENHLTKWDRLAVEIVTVELRDLAPWVVEFKRLEHLCRKQPLA